MLIEVTGKIKFEPEHVTKKHIKQYDWKRTAIVYTECDLYLYYAWFIRKRFNLELIRPLRGTHMTFINEVVDYEKFEEAKKIFDDKPLKFYHGIEPRISDKHIWLRAYSQEAEEIRIMLGLERQPFFDFHLTLGLINPKQIDQSRHILECCKLYGIISNEPRKKFSDEEIKIFYS
jgi:hypothetical protein